MELSGSQVETISGCKVYSYHDLISYFELEEILQNKPGFTILYEDHYDEGHYCGVLVNNHGIEFFDPYGFGKFNKIKSSNELSLHDIDDEINFSRYDKNLNFDQCHTLKYLIGDYAKRNDKKIIINHHQFQELDDNISTCGRWVGYRLRCHDLSLQQFEKLGLNDKKIVEITNKILDPNSQNFIGSD